MKNDLNDEVLIGTPKILIPLDGVLNSDGVRKQVVNQRGTMLHILKVGQKDLSHEVQCANVRMQRIQWRGVDDVSVVCSGWK